MSRARGTDASASVLLAPDKFKGSLTSRGVADELAAGVADVAGHWVEVSCLPLADGGDGSVDAALDAGYLARPVRVPGPTGRPVDAVVAHRLDTVLVEVAGTCGLQQLPGGAFAPLDASSRGVGAALRQALDLRPKRVVLALGGSASTDGGLGMLLELGAIVEDLTDGADEPPARTLLAGRPLDLRPLQGLPVLDGVDLVLATDVTSPLLGPHGAPAVFGPQKGASPAVVAQLETALEHLVAEAGRAGHRAAELAMAPGAGAAGGLGFAGLLLGGRVVNGADFFLDLLGFDEAARGRDLVVTGEGRLDEQSLAGKLPIAVARRISGRSRVEAVVGRCDLDVARVRARGIEAVHEVRSLTQLDTAANPELTRRLLRRVGRSIGSELLDRTVAQRSSRTSSGLASASTAYACSTGTSTTS